MTLRRIGGWIGSLGLVGWALGASLAGSAWAAPAPGPALAVTTTPANGAVNVPPTAAVVWNGVAPRGGPLVVAVTNA